MVDTQRKFFEKMRTCDQNVGCIHSLIIIFVFKFSHFFNSLVFSWKRVKLSCMNTTTDVYVKILSNVKIK